MATETKPARGDVFYKCFNGTIEKVVFQEETATGAFVFRQQDGSVFQCSPDMYVPSEREALQRYLNDINDAIPRAAELVVDAQAHCRFLDEEKSRIELLLSEQPDA